MVAARMLFVEYVNKLYQMWLFLIFIPYIHLLPITPKYFFNMISLVYFFIFLPISASLLIKPQEITLFIYLTGVSYLFYNFSSYSVQSVHYVNFPSLFTSAKKNAVEVDELFTASKVKKWNGFQVIQTYSGNAISL